jgi:hypothetical protein
MVRRSDEGCSATQKLDFLRRRHSCKRKHSQNQGSGQCERASQRLKIRSRGRISAEFLSLGAERRSPPTPDVFNGLG